ncbi:MAG: DnaJ domain-containing protein [Deltaproteobacteria bacterium]|nr:DnaJ domain-containing protein [Deltaproteobacteria bacterium]
MLQRSLIKKTAARAKTVRCVSCGTTKMNRGRRYCSTECQKQLRWVLSLARGLLYIFSARYAAFSFDKNHVILDVLPSWADEISRFSIRRGLNNKPADDLKGLILQSGEEWHQIIGNKNSMSFATQSLLEKNRAESLVPDSIRPENKWRPKFSRDERISAKILDLKAEEFLNDEHQKKIKSAYKKLAKLHHPDMGGDAGKFRQVSDAHKQMIMWAQNPQYTSKKALPGCWSYDVYADKWSPPL